MPRMPNVGLLGARPPPGMMRGPRMPPPPGYHPSMFYDDYPLHQEGEEEVADVAYEQDMPYEQDITGDYKGKMSIKKDSIKDVDKTLHASHLYCCFCTVLLANVQPIVSNF